MINFNTDKLILIYYPSGAGGKFLKNSLGLSDFSVFQSSTLADDQINGKFSKLDKINYLINELDNMHDKWNDLNLGCWELAGPAAAGVASLKIMNLNDNIRQYFEFFKVIEDLTNKNYYFFLGCHDITELAKTANFWPNAKIIEFINYGPFQEKYRKINDNNYSIVKGSDWPKKFPSIDEYLNLDKNIQEEIITYYPGFEYFKNNSSQAKRVIFQWDTENYMSYDKTLRDFKELCSILKLHDIDFNSFELYYRRWVDKLCELSPNYK